MTIEDSGPAEEYPENRNADRQLWRHTQRQISELASKIERFAEESRATDKRLEEKIGRLGDKVERLADESRAADKRLQERIESLVPAIGCVLTK